MALNKPYRQILTLFRDFGILILIGNSLSIFMVPKGLWSMEIILRNCMFSILFGYPSWKGMGYIVALLERKIPWLKYPIKRLVYQILGLTIFSGLIIFVGFAIWIQLTEGLDFRSAIEFISPSLKVVYIFLFLAMVLGNAVLFFRNWREATIQQEELKRAHLALQYQSLRDQVRPHFLFNSLSSLVTLINTDSEKATRFVHKLSDVYRYLLEQRENELVPLEAEMKFLEDYIYLQKIRFGENLRVNISPGMNLKRMLIPLSLQMIVENAIKHNEISAEHPLNIDIYSGENEQVVIRNNMQKKEILEKTPGTGIENLRKRIAFFSAGSLLIEENTDFFTVTIPTIPS